MIQQDRLEDALLALTRIYSTFYQYCDLTMNKTMNISEVCMHIARLKYVAGDLDNALDFYREAYEKAHGEKAKSDLKATVDEIMLEKEGRVENQEYSASKDHPIHEMSDDQE